MYYMTTFIEAYSASEQGKCTMVRADDISIVYYVYVIRSKDNKTTYRVVVELNSGRRVDISDHATEQEAKANLEKLLQIISGTGKSVGTRKYENNNVDGESTEVKRKGRQRKHDE